MKKLTLYRIPHLPIRKFLERNGLHSGALLASLLFHLLLILCLVFTGPLSKDSKRELIVIDFRLSSLDPLQEGKIASSKGGPHKPVEEHNQEANMERSSGVKEEEQKKSQEGIELRQEVRSDPLDGKLKVEGLSLREGEKGEEGYRDRGGQAVLEGGAKLGTGDLSDKSSLSGGDGGQEKTGEEASQKYLTENFKYIREIIARNTFYPPLARRMGWSGKVTLSFVVAEDGSVRDIQIIERSGYEILDRSAVETVKRSAPFPKPPVAVRIILPIVYRLN